ncbi:MAG: hypothetical protein HRT45_12930 [Bdellovibrionales bacterium]|nr:hypothetical protein [Bdellovibrionales bacterium]
MYTKGGEKKTWGYKDITGQELPADAEKKGIPEIGGGWFRVESLISLESVDWEKNQAIFKYAFKDELLRFDLTK